MVERDKPAVTCCSPAARAVVPAGKLYIEKLCPGPHPHLWVAPRVSQPAHHRTDDVGGQEWGRGPDDHPLWTPQPGRDASEQSMCVWLPWRHAAGEPEHRGVRFQALLPRPPRHLRGRAADKGLRTLMGRMAAEGAGHGSAFCTSVACVQPWGRGSHAATHCHTRGAWGESV